ncbi:maternal protein exuperantia-like [Anopheles maculipalpis]|uniref:maternal protein exuperantia-like n=1 Tax=Anopheles maculipalpis TaxID=1496333 RepID=UPI00215962C4|nr:maternal protein exuperantia-like [Anopheles maculipalpis]
MVAGVEESKVGVDEEQHYDDSSFDECDTPAGVLSSKFDKTDVSINTNPLPHGKYTLIGIDIDTTGRRLIDEIVQISAFTPDKQYAQYIMPLMNLNPAARQRHQVRVITVGFFRMLKSMQTYRVMKTKMEIAALNEFLDWLEERRREDEGSEGIVLVYHEQRKFVPYMVIEALKKYKLLDRFAETVKSFVNGFKLAEEKCTKTIKYLTIRQLAMIVLDEKEGSREGFEGNAAYRARMAFEISRCLATAEPKDTASASSPTETEPNVSANSEEVASSSSTADDAVKVEGDQTTENAGQTVEEETAQKENEKKEGAAAGTSNSSASRPLTEEDREKMCTVLCEYASPISNEISELDEQEKILVRQNSLRPVFLLYFKTTIYHRVKAVTYRRVLAESGHNYESLRQLWQEKKREGMEAIINEIAELKEEERTELVELLDCHYDPDKQAFKPIVKRMKRRPSRGQPFFSNKNSNVPQQQNGNSQMAKENRKPFHGYQNNQKNFNNNHNGNNMMNKQQNHHQNQQQQQFYNGPTSPESNMRNGGGSPGKRFYQRNSRRRRGGNGQNQNQNQQNGGQNQQSLKNHNDNRQSHANSNRHNNHHFQQPIPSHA